jgi:hypothetical protein
MSADTGGFKLFSKKLRSADKPTYRAMQKGLRTAGKVIASKAAENALSGGAGRKVAKSIKVRAQLNTVRVAAGNKKTPLAVWYEFGRTQKSKKWSHPIFPFSANDPHAYRQNMKPQPRPHRPYLRIALLQMRKPAADIVAQAMVEALAEVLSD